MRSDSESSLLPAAPSPPTATFCPSTVQGHSLAFDTDADSPILLEFPKFHFNSFLRMFNTMLSPMEIRAFNTTDETQNIRVIARVPGAAPL